MTIISRIWGTRRRVALAPLLFAAIWLPMTSAASTTPALASCNPQATDPSRPDVQDAFFDEWYSYTSSPGVYASILNYDPFISSAHSNDVSASWVMLEDTATFHWAQVGWWKVFNNGSATRESYDQYWNPYAMNGVTTDHFPQYTGAVGTTTNYEIFDDQTQFLFIINNTSVSSDTVMFTPNVQYVSGEINDLLNQMPGGVSSHEVFNNAWSWSTSTNTWQPFGGATYITSSGHGNTYNNYFGSSQSPAPPSLPSQVEIWDQYCQS